MTQANSKTVTPFMAQYMEIKARYPDSLLFFRMGDFYELFFEDAEIAAGVLDITLTKTGPAQRGSHPDGGRATPRLRALSRRLIRAGHRVAVCEQTESPAEAKKRGSKSVVNRDVVRIVTPGTLTEDTMLEARADNFLCALTADADNVICGVALADISTGRFIVLSAPIGAIMARISGYAPREIVMSDALRSNPALSSAFQYSGIPAALHETRQASASGGRQALSNAFDLSSADGLGHFEDVELAAMGLLLSYVELTQAGIPPELDYPNREPGEARLMLDETTRQALEIDRTQTGQRKGSLLATIDQTQTSAGARLLADYISRPLTDTQEIDERLDAIQCLIEQTDLRLDLRGLLKAMPDLDRARSRLRLGRASPQDLKAVRLSLATAGKLRTRFEEDETTLSDLLRQILHRLTVALDEGLTGLKVRLEGMLVEDPPAVFSDGGFIRKGASEELDRLRTLRDDSKQIIAGLEARYQTETGISALRIRYNAMLGYFIEIQARNVEAFEALPDANRFHRRQGLANATRYSTEELMEIAREIENASTSAKTLEFRIFSELSEETLRHSDALRQCSEATSRLDVACAGAHWAELNSACRPILFADRRLTITGGRHPVVEAALRGTGTGFVSNEVELGNAGDQTERLKIITGPNMAGKSTFLRQTALLVILAQAGWFVPAKSMELGIVDRVFSRVGASDDLARGKSTFMVEMLETASILNQASDRALVILDEVGRGTSTYDGLAIAWSCVEYLHDTIRCRGLFATHYHELTKLAARLPFAGNLSLKAREWRGDLIFLHEVQEGPADRSYGVQVARLAGLPKLAVARARQVLSELEASKSSASPTDDMPLFSFSENGADSSQMSPDGPPGIPTHAALSALDEIDPDELSPKEALEALYHLKGLLNASDP